MKRFIDLRGQILLDDKTPAFAFYCTFISRFETFCDEQYWHSKAEFLESVGDEQFRPGPYHGLVDVERYLGLMPDWVPEK